MGWQRQRKPRHARSHFNGCLASMRWFHHDGICATIGDGLFDTGHLGDLSNVSVSMLLADFVLLIKHVSKSFWVAQEAKALPSSMSQAIKMHNMDAAVQSLHLDN